MSTLATVLEHPDIARIFLSEITVGRIPKLWTQDTTAYWTDATLPDDSKYNRSWSVDDVKDNGTSLTKVADIATVKSTSNSWTYDFATNRVYINISNNPYQRTVQVVYKFYFSTTPKVFQDASGTDHYYEPRIKSVPNMSLRVEATFSAVTQIGGGNISMNNEDGFFDKLVDLQWNAGKTVVYLGAEVSPTSTGDSASFSEYQIIGTWLNDGWTKRDDTFSMSLKESKIRIKNKIPTQTYDRSTYPNIRDDDLGRAVQIAYGVIKDANPVCIDTTVPRFKVAGHSIISFDGVRVKNESTGVWETKNFVITDPNTAEFTLSSSDWSVDQEIAVDFTGKAKTTTQEYDNPADVVKDILQSYLGETNINTASFDAAYSEYDIGLYTATQKRHTVFPVSIYIDEPTDAESIIKKINRVCGAYLYADAAGQYFYKAFTPPRGEGLPELNESDILSIEHVVKIDAKTKCTVKYARRYSSDWSEVTSYQSDSLKYLHGLSEHQTIEIDAPLSTSDSAQLAAQRIVFYEGHPQNVWRMTVPSRKAATFMPADAVKIKYSRHGIDNVFEILSVSHNLVGDKTTLTVGDLHGLGERPGWLVGDSDTLPSRFANLAGYGSGSLVWNASWDDEIKTWARQNVGYWTDDNGFASSSDERSKDISEWI